MMLGARIEKTRVAARQASQAASPGDSRPRLGVANLRVGTKLNDVSLDLANGEVAGIVALEGQGQDELFSALAGSIRPSGGT
ncbi:MAG: sugar ABC transporter ATP-binding protein, partial [Mesorhizobium sp.]